MSSLPPSSDSCARSVWKVPNAKPTGLSAPATCRPIDSNDAAWVKRGSKPLASWLRRIGSVGVEMTREFSCVKRKGLSHFRPAYKSKKPHQQPSAPRTAPALHRPRQPTPGGHGHGDADGHGARPASAFSMRRATTHQIRAPQIRGERAPIPRPPRCSSYQRPPPRAQRPPRVPPPRRSAKPASLLVLPPSAAALRSPP